jgi:DNA-binding GntR family transcriptional regulator
MKLSKSLKDDSTSVTHRIYEKIRMAILTGEIQAGERLVELDLAAKVQSSRTPVREALQKIASEGLIYSIPRAGYIVDEISETDLEEIFEARIAIEQAAARLALKHITPDEIEMIKANIEESEKSIKSGLKDQMVDFDTEFHDILCGASRNKRLIQFSQTLRDHLLRYRMIALRIPRMAKGATAEHKQIFRALQSKDSRKLEETIHYHMERSKEHILTCLRDQSMTH